MFVSADRQQRFLFSQPFMRRSHVLYGRGGERIDDPAQLAGRRVAVQFGGMAWEWLINEGFDAVLQPVNEESLVLAEVVRGDADFALLPSDIGQYTIAMQGLQGVEPVSPPWLERDYAFGADVKLEDEGDVTILNYEVTAQVGGKLAQMGSRLIDSTSKQLASQFFSNLNEVITGEKREQETA